MAKGDVVAMRDKAGEELATLQAALEKIQSEARGIGAANEQRAAVVARINEAKREVAIKADEYGELARTAALVAGGTNHRPQR